MLENLKYMFIYGFCFPDTGIRFSGFNKNKPILTEPVQLKFYEHP
jgi:hypothetical protein